MNTAFVRTTLIGTLAAAALLPTAGCDTVGPLVLQSSEQSIEAYEVLTREWLRWAMITPMDISPIGDTTGELCDVNQGDGPWFLAGTFGGSVERDCTIPADTPLFFPLVNRWVVPGDSWVETPGNYDYYVDTWLPNYQANGRANTCDLTLRIDGQDILADKDELDAELYVAITEPFEVELAENNYWTWFGNPRPAGTYHYAAADGHWALFKPLSPGDHTLELGGKICNANGEVTFETHATYHLHVEGKKKHHHDD